MPCACETSIVPVYPQNNDVILEVVSVVRHVLPGLLQDATPTVACIRTTRPKYLVFDHNSSRPVCVVEFGPVDRLLRVHQILSELHNRVPGLVPRSLCYAPWQCGMYVHIEEGLAGVPWFRVSDRLTMTADWRCLLNRAVNAMVELHCAIREVPAWVGNVSIRAELTHQACLAESRGISLSTRALRCIDEWAGVFGEAESQSGIWQHGDFSLNNLLVSADSLAVIDFDEFGSTLMDGKHVLVAKSPEDFADKVVKLLDEPALAVPLVTASRALVEQNYGWNAIGERLDAFYRRIGSAQWLNSPELFV